MLLIQKRGKHPFILPTNDMVYRHLPTHGILTNDYRQSKYELLNNLIEFIKFGRMRTRLFMLFEAIQPNFISSRKLNCWTAAITKSHRKIYERMYPTILVFPNGSSINIEYHVPRKIITLPLKFDSLSHEEKKLVLERRKPKTKVKIEEDFEDDDYDASKYLKLIKKK